MPSAHWLPARILSGRGRARKRRPASLSTYHEASRPTCGAGSARLARRSRGQKSAEGPSVLPGSYSACVWLRARIRSASISGTPDRRFLDDELIAVESRRDTDR
jgi:hypothetical protein